MPDERTHDIYHVDEPEGYGAPQGVTAELEQAEARIEELEAKLADLERWRAAAFIVHSNLDLDIEADPQALEELKGQDMSYDLDKSKHSLTFAAPTVNEVTLHFTDKSYTLPAVEHEQYDPLASLCAVVVELHNRVQALEAELKGQ